MNTTMTQKRIQSPVRWVGGKSATARWILSHLPPAHTYESFVDVFGGSANILLNKPRSGHYEVFNDYDTGLVNFWMQVRDNCQQVVEMLTTLPYSYELYRKWYEEPVPEDKVEWAVRWFYLLRSNFKAVVKEKPDGWRSSKRGKGYSEADAFRAATGLLRLVSTRFQGVEIDCRDYNNVIQRTDSLETVFYCDPPYIHAEQYYTKTIKHQTLSDLLHAVKGKVVLSYYDCEEVRRLYPNWRVLTYQKQKMMDITRKDGVGNELLLFNF